MDAPSFLSTASSAASASASFATHASQQGPVNNANGNGVGVVPVPGSREQEVVRLVEQLRAHVLSKGQYPQQAGSSNSSQQAQAQLKYYLSVLFSRMQPPRRAVDEFASLQQARRRATQGGLREQDPERAEKLGLRLEELLRKLQRPALEPLLRRRWSILYLLSELARPTPMTGGAPNPANTSANGSAANNTSTSSLHSAASSSYSSFGPGADALDSFLAPELPPAALLPPAATTAATTRAAAPRAAAVDASVLSSASLAGGRMVAATEDSAGPLWGGEEQELQRREAAAAEWRLLRDCLYVFQGIDGQHLAYDAGSGQHVLDPELRAVLSPAQADAALRMAEMGWLFRKVQAFAERGNSGNGGSSSSKGGAAGGRLRRPGMPPPPSSSSSSSSSRGGGGGLGLVGQAWCFVLQDELTEYYRLIAVLESQLAEQQPPPPPLAMASASASASFLSSTTTTAAGAAGAVAAMPAAGAGMGAGALTLRRLAVWVEEPLSRLRLLATLCDSLEYVRGGALASVLVAHGQQGDPAGRQLVRRVLGRVCLPIFEMVRRWILEGELVDPHGEFFVSSSTTTLPDPSTATAAATASGSDEGVGALPLDEQLWHHTYHLRRDMVPKFIPLELAQRILVLGKSVAFMRRCCKDREWINSALKARVAAEPLSHGNPEALQRVVDGVAEVVNTRLRGLILGKHQLMTHLRALKKFLALGQGDFVTCLMDSVGPELGKLAGQVYRHDLTGKLEAALRASNAQYEQADILNRLGVRLLEASAGEDGWEVFSLDYQVEAPLSAIIHSKALGEQGYARIFHLLWRIKRVEWSLAASWKDHMVVGHLPSAGARRHRHRRPGSQATETETAGGVLAGVLQACNLARREMVHFVANLSSFMMFEVLETSWTALQADVGKAADLDALVRAHDAYLKRIADTAFLGPDKARLHAALQAVLSMILEFCALHSNLCADAMREEAAATTGPSGGGGAVLLGRYQQRVQATTAEYGRAMGELITLLRAQEQESDAVRFLIFRLDFNEYYSHAHARFGSRLDDAAAAAGAGAGAGVSRPAAGGSKTVRLMV